MLGGGSGSSPGPFVGCVFSYWESGLHEIALRIVYCRLCAMINDTIFNHDFDNESFHLRMVNASPTNFNIVSQH